MGDVCWEKMVFEERVMVFFVWVAVVGCEGGSLHLTENNAVMVDLGE